MDSGIPIELIFQNILATTDFEKDFGSIKMRNRGSIMRQMRTDLEEFYASAILEYLQNTTDKSVYKLDDVMGRRCFTDFYRQ